MKCRRCHFENPAGNAFCGRCGARLETVCTRCAFRNPGAFHFCGRCGARLPPSAPAGAGPPPADERLEKIARYLPTGIAQKILAQKDRIEGEKRQVTVMFCDLEGYTRFADRRGPEETYDFMDGIYEILIAGVHRYGGTVNELTGDGIMALFGAPISLEDAPQRAIRAALAIQKKMAAVGAEERASGRPAATRMRIGIHSGPVVVGSLGSDLRVEFKAVGNTVNLAARMEEMAEPGTIYVTADTYRLAEGFFAFEKLGHRAVKGLDNRVATYRVIAPLRGRTRFDVNAERGLTPFVDRELERRLLIDCFEQAKSGRGQAFAIVAEAGVGKSRLLFEFRKTVAHEEVIFVDGRCLSYGKNMAYQLVIDVLASIFDLSNEDDAPTVEKKIRSRLNALDIDAGEVLPHLMELLSIWRDDNESAPLRPEAKKEKIVAALCEIALRGARVRPLVISLEDLHWIDSSSVEFLKHLMKHLSRAAIFLIFTYRPEFDCDRSIRGNCHRVILNRLSQADSTHMISHFLGSGAMDELLEKVILEKTEGVPLFIEEFIKSCRDLAIIEQKRNHYRLSRNFRKMTIPATIQDVIMARVDTLSENAREILQTGAAIEREFGCDLIMRVMGIDERELADGLAVLKDAELLYERGAFPRSTIVFRHALTREVVYDAILTRKKEQLHRTIAAAIVDLHRDGVEEHYSVLAEHCIAGKDHERGAEYARLASKRYEKTGALHEAIRYARKTISSLEALPGTEGARSRIVDARVGLGLYYTQFNFHAEAKAVVDPIAEIVMRGDNRKRMSQIHIINGTFDYLSREDFPAAFEHLELALEIAETDGDIVTSFFANHFLGLALSFNCQFDRALVCYRKALGINEAARTLWGISAMKSMISYFVHFSRGNLDASLESSREALALAGQSGDVYSKAIAHTSFGISCYGKGFVDKARAHLSRGIELCESVDLFYWNAMAQATLGELCFERGDPSASMRHHRNVVAMLSDRQMIPFWVGVNRMGAARSAALEGAEDVEPASLASEVAANRVRIADGWMKRYMAEIELNSPKGSPAAAERWIQAAIAADGANHLRFNLAKDHACCCRLHRSMGRVRQAGEARERALAIFGACGADPDWFDRFMRSAG